MILPARKRIRLKTSAYSEPGRAFSITIGTLHRKPVFDNLNFGLECIETLRQLREIHASRVYAYCLMPDHAHLLVSASESASIPSFVGRWKSLCYRARRRHGSGEPFWQRSFYDHGLRDGEGLLEASRYIVGNPVRAGLVTDFHDYRLCGSFEFKL